MKTSIALTLIITAAIFSFVSGYSIGNHKDPGVSYSTINQSSTGSIATANAAENVQKATATTGGYGSSSEEATANNAASPGYGQ